jgi:hypothetical protein
MTERNKQHDEEPGFAVSAEFRGDLGRVFGPPGEVPAAVDRAVAEAARRHFARRRRRLWWVRWAAPAAAAAAVIALCVWLPGHRAPAPHAARVAAEIQQADIDRNGRVDILDAFRLARHIESAGPMNEMWDINGDGLIDRADVERVAQAAVRLNKGA